MIYISNKRFVEKTKTIFANVEVYYSTWFLHRKNGPAQIFRENNFGDFTIKWYKKQKQHRIDGPAVIDQYRLKNNKKTINLTWMFDDHYCVEENYWNY